MRIKIMPARAPAILSSVPTYLNWSGSYWTLACLPEDIAVLNDAAKGLLTACPAVGVCKVLAFLLDEYLNFLWFDFLDTCSSLSKIIWL